MLAQILAERLKMDINQIHVRMKVDTETTPEHWKSVGSRGTFMAGRATLNAADDVINQLKEVASCVLRAPKEDLEVANSRVFLRDDPSIGLHFKDIGYGYKYPNGNSIGGQIIGRGKYILRHITHLDPETGAGKPGPEWSVAAYGVEIEFDRKNYTYRLVNAAAVVDAGRVMNEKTALGQVMGAMSMGLAFAGRETFYFDDLGRVLNLKIVNLLITLIAILLVISGCSTQVPKEENKVGDISRHSVFNLDAETIKSLEKGIIKGTPLRLDNDIKMSDVERIWGKPNEHFDHEDIQTYGYTIENQNFIINEDEMKEIYSIQVELDYSKAEILEMMGKPTKPGNIFIYEKENYIIQFEKFNNKWRLILRKK